jgi:hypothetical protein
MAIKQQINALSTQILVVKQYAKVLLRRGTKSVHILVISAQ